MKVYITHGGRLIWTLNGFEWSLHATATLTPKKYLPIPNGYDAVWVSLPVWRLIRREKSLVAAGREPHFLICPVRSLVTMLNAISFASNGTNDEEIWNFFTAVFAAVIY